MESFRLLSQRFARFKELTHEENKIIDLIRENVLITQTKTIIDIGSNRGVISHAVQPRAENITLIDVEDFDIKTGAKFLKGKWEEVEVEKKEDLIIASHVWGHFHHDGTTRRAFFKALNSTKDGGNVILCYNANNDIVGNLITICKNLFSDFQYDVFDESLLKDLSIKEIVFNVSLKVQNFNQLTDLMQVLMIAPDEVYESKKEQIRSFLEKKLEKPELNICQKLIIIQK